MEKLQKYVPPNPESSNSESRDFLMFGATMYEVQSKETDLSRIENSFASLSEDDREWINVVHEKLGIRGSLAESVAKGVKSNANFLIKVVTDSLESVVPHSRANRPLNHSPESLQLLAGRIRSIPLVAAREWSSYLAPERELTHARIREAVSKYCPRGSVLVPGSSAGRLVYEIAGLGLQAVGIEHDSLRVMLMHSIFAGEKFEIFPFILDTCNRLTAQDNQIPVHVPDIELDSTVLSRITINGNEFFETNYPESEFQCIVTSWFIDSMNIDMERFIREVKRVLKPNGIWVNCGPLDFAYSAEKEVARRIGNPKRSMDEVTSLVESSGFQIVEQSEVESTYFGNPRTIMETKLTCLFFVAKLDA